MKRILKTILLLLLFVSCSYHPNTSTVNEDGASWMSKLNDDTTLTSLVIPGTHDSLALYDFAIAGTAAAQDMSFYNQLINGVRFFDLRLSKDSDGSLQIYHGIKRMYITFEDIVEMAVDFLQKNPDEFLIFMIKEEIFNIWPGNRDGRNIVDEIEKIVRDNEAYFYQKTSILEEDTSTISEEIDSAEIKYKSIAIKELRGKILILRNYVESETYDITHGCSLRDEKWQWFAREGDSSNVSVNNSYPKTVDEKWEQVSEYIDERSQETDDHVLYLHSVASYYKYDNLYGLPNIDKVCSVINPRLLDKLTTEKESLRKKPLGIYMCDKIYPELIKAMYDLNF